MSNNDTIEFLKECDSAIKMGVSSLNEVLDNVKDDKLKEILSDSKKSHEQLGVRTKNLLSQYDKFGKEPNIMAKSMSWLKTNVQLAINGSDTTIADLVTDGCNMGVKSISKYLNQYKTATPDVCDIAYDLISIEEKLAIDLRSYL